MFDLLVYFKTEIETVGRQMRDIAATLNQAQALERPVPGVNHALWLLGHMTWAEDYLLREVPAGKSSRRKEWDQFFDHSSEKLPPERYPAWKDVRAEYTRVHAEMLRHLASLSAAALDRPCALERQWVPTAAHSLGHQATHGHYHLGQLIYLQKFIAQADSASAGEAAQKAQV